MMIQNPVFSQRKNLMKRNLKYNPPNFLLPLQENLYKFQLAMIVMKKIKKRKRNPLMIRRRML